jgi:putative ABC transport system substrate-binding protein
MLIRLALMVAIERLTSGGWRLARVCLLLCTISVLSWSSEVLIVLSGEHEPYRQTQQSLVKELGTEGHHINELLLNEPNKTYVIPSSTTCVVSIGTPASLWLQQQTYTGKKVYCMVSDPESVGLLRPPSMSGISTDVPISAQLTLIKETLPEAKIIGTLYRKKDPKSVTSLDNLRKYLPPEWSLEAVAIEDYDSPAGGIDALLDKRLDVVWTAPDPVIYTNASVRSLLLTSLRRRVPVFGFSTSFVRAGALMGVGIDPAKQGLQAAQQVRHIFTGSQTSETIILPTFDVCLNLVVAQKLSLKLPPAVIKRANQLFSPGQ